ncbi:PPK2 family polyphosphate kinase [Micromonospora sp. WMMD558]|uniref:PPK2 family polyphosphate kinase n=1 Tax=unclassified Micromonospora TaxID=2617518 RepID=UPI001E34EAEE|nr:PPK2 family polyphosphate kinase [Micromonospora sp. WMMC415]
MSGIDEVDVVPPVDGPMRDLLRVGPDGLGAVDPGSTPGLPGRAVTGEDRKGWARAQVRLLGDDLARRQEMLFATAKARAGAAAAASGGTEAVAGASAGAAGAPRVLLVLQAMDCGGKDGTVKRVAGAMNPLGLHIRSFGPPTPEELRHDFLWRIRRALPPPGYVGVFNRSHYEDVLVARVESLVPEATWRARYDEINAFERELVGAGMALVKVLLHISYDEQGRRLLQRLDDPRKHWKYDPSDIDARARWDDYQSAYAEALSRCGTDAAPWYVVPADRKWYRDWAVAHLLRETFDTLALGYPAADFDVQRERERLLGFEETNEGERKVNEQ